MQGGFRVTFRSLTDIASLVQECGKTSEPKRVTRRLSYNICVTDDLGILVFEGNAAGV